MLSLTTAHQIASRMFMEQNYQVIQNRRMKRELKQQQKIRKNKKEKGEKKENI